VIDHRRRPVVRRAARLTALVPAVTVLLAAGPASAVPPEAWPDADPPSTLQVLLLLAGIPLLLFTAIAFLVYVPSMARGSRYTPGLAWRNENEWFGGPSGGVEALDRSDASTSSGHERPAGALTSPNHDTGSAPDETDERGGASARW